MQSFGRHYSLRSCHAPFSGRIASPLQSGDSVADTHSGSTAWPCRTQCVRARYECKGAERRTLSAAPAPVCSWSAVAACRRWSVGARLLQVAPVLWMLRGGTPRDEAHPAGSPCPERDLLQHARGPCRNRTLHCTQGLRAEGACHAITMALEKAVLQVEILIAIGIGDLARSRPTSHVRTGRRNAIGATSRLRHDILV